MNILKKIFAILVISLLVVTTGCAKKQEDTLNEIQQRGKLIVGVKYDTPPFGQKTPRGGVAGFDVDLARAIAREMFGNPNAVEFKQVTAGNRILALNSGQVDMIIATMTITSSRKQIVDFSVPYFYAGQAILVPKNSEITSIRQLNNKKVAVVFGTTAEKSLMQFAPESQVLGYKTYTSAYQALKQGRVSAMTSDDTILLGIAMHDKSVKLLPKRYTKEPYAIAVKKGSYHLLNKLNFIIADLTRTGQLRLLKYSWIKY